MMNKRIKELIEQATTEEHDGFRYFDKRKFAELIVKECAAMTRNLSPHGELAEKAVKEHFGVEE